MESGKAIKKLYHLETNNKAHYRENILLGMEVEIVLKKDQKTGKLTRGFVQWILTSASYHSRGIKVQLTDRRVGRVQEIISGTESFIKS